MKHKVDVLTEVTRVLKMEGQAILSCEQRLHSSEAQTHLRNALNHFESALQNGGKIVVTGLGKSGKVCQKIAATMCSTGSLAVYLHPTEGLHGDLGLVSKKDAVLALSYTGNTDELVRLLQPLKSLGVAIVGLGGNAQSKMAMLCDAWIDGSVEQEACPHNLAPTSSTTLALALGDALAMALMQLRGFDAEAFAQNHPGGSLGKRLNLKVKDVMHAGAELPIVSVSASVDDVVVLSTKMKLGAVLVGEGKQLRGIITDGDLRRALGHREKFFTLKAKDVMTAKPITVRSEMMAKEALDLMENRQSQINVLPVVDEAGNIQGIVRLHDLVRSF